MVSFEIYSFNDGWSFFCPPRFNDSWQHHRLCEFYYSYRWSWWSNRWSEHQGNKILPCRAAQLTFLWTRMWPWSASCNLWPSWHHFVANLHFVATLWKTLVESTVLSVCILLYVIVKCARHDCYSVSFKLGKKSANQGSQLSPLKQIFIPSQTKFEVWRGI